MGETVKEHAKGLEIRYSRPILVLKSEMESLARPLGPGLKIVGVRSSQNRYFLILIKNRENQPYKGGQYPLRSDPPYSNMNPRTVLQGLTPPKVHERAGDRELSRVAMTLILEGEVSEEVEEAIKGLMDDVARAATIVQGGTDPGRVVQADFMEKAPRGMLERMKEGQAMYVTAGWDFKTDAIAQGMIEAAMQDGVDVGTHMGVAFNRAHTMVGKGTPDERELVAMRVWLKDRRARDYWVAKGTLTVKGHGGAWVETKIHQKYSKGGSKYESDNPRSDGKRWDDFFPYMRRLGKADPKEWDRGEATHEWQHARTMLMQGGVHGGRGGSHESGST